MGPTFYDEIKSITGSDETATKILKLFDRSKNRVGLTESQQRVLDYLRSGKPIASQRQMAQDCGFDHPQKLVAVTAALVFKGHLVPREEPTDA